MRDVFRARLVTWPRAARWFRRSPGLAAEFLRGFLHPSLPALAVAALVLVALLASALLLPCEAAFLRTFGPYLVTSDIDDLGFLTLQIAQLEQSPPDRPGVLLLGSSAMREAVSREDRLEALLAGATSPSPDVLNFTAWGLSPWEMVAVSDRLPVGFRGVVVLGVSLRMVHAERSKEGVRARMRDPRLGLTSAALDDEARRLGVGVPPRRAYLWDNRDYLAQRLPCLLGNLLHGPPAQSTDRFRGEPPRGADNWREAMRRNEAFFELAQRRPELADTNLAILSRMIRRFQERGDVEVVLLQTPIHPDFVRDVIGEARYAEFREPLRRLAEQHGAEYWFLDPEVAWTGEDFHDQVHLASARAQERYQQVLAGRLARLLRGSPPPTRDDPS